MPNNITDGDLILVTGASGYLATHIVKQLLELGCRVRGTVRSVKDEKKCEPLRKLAVNPKHELELVEADLQNEQSWLSAVKGCTYVVHTASPVPNKVLDDENDVIRPAVDGVLNVFKAAVQEGTQVKRVVLTSSLASVAGDQYMTDHVYSESDFSAAADANGYIKSKILAEKAAWDFVGERKKANQSCFELVVINPGYIAGIMCREMALIPQLSLPLCDVRDVALAHVRSLQFYEVVGKRHLLVSTREPHNLKQYALWLKEEFGSKGYSISTREAPNFLLKLVGMVNKTVAFVVPMLGKVPNFDNARFVDVLKIQPIDPRKTMIDMTYSMIERGFIPKKF